MNREMLLQDGHLHGFITEQNFDEAEEAFPGIVTFYEHCRTKPMTFLDLVWQFEKALPDHADMPQAGLPAVHRLVTWLRRVAHGYGKVSTGQRPEH